MNFQKIEMFSNPVFGCIENIGEENRNMLISDSLSWRKSSLGLNVSNCNGWHSEDTLFIRKEKSFKFLCELLIKRTNQVTKHIAPNWSEDLYSTFGNGWININNKNALNLPHDHGGFIWSGVYYLQIPETKNSRSGSIEFIDPRLGLSNLTLGLSELKEGFRGSSCFTPAQDQLIIFPSWLKHFVHPNLEDEERISIAFNAGYKKID